MAGLRRSIALASADRYLIVLLNFATLLITARLLTPAEFGIAVLGLAALGAVNIVRDFGGTAYIVQVDNPTPERVQTVFTVTSILTLPFVVLMYLGADWIAEFYGEPGLVGFLQLTIICFLFGPFIAPIYALLRREMAFDRIMLMSAICAVVNTVATIALVLLGFSYMSFAWAGLASAATYLVLCNVWGPKFKVYRFSLSEWRQVMSYGAYESSKSMLYYLWDVLPLLAFGKTLGAAGVGLYQRAVSISRLPEKTILAGLAPVLLPALSRHAREGRDLKIGYLKSLEHLSAVLWPIFLFVILFAHPIVLLLLGHQWLETVPLVQIIAVAMLFWLPPSLPDSTLIAAGAIRQNFLLALTTIPVAVAIQIYMSQYGLRAATLSLLFTIPMWALASLYVVRKVVPFTFGELWEALRRSAIVALMSCVGPAAVAIWVGGGDHITLFAGVLGGATALGGWLAGLWLTGHSLLGEVRHVTDFLTNTVSTRIFAKSSTDGSK